MIVVVLGKFVITGGSVFLTTLTVRVPRGLLNDGVPLSRAYTVS